MSVAVSILGGASTLVASFMTRTNGTNEPQASKYCAQALDHFLREIEDSERKLALLYPTTGPQYCDI